MNIRLGIIGLSPGNGHPFSWSAIFNGYDPEEMEGCGFPVIPRYLEKQKWPGSAIPGAKVTHVWTQNPDLSRKVSRASLIPNVVADPAEMIGKVDAVILARDDAENHFRLARPFLECGLPLFVDKPAARSLRELDALFALAKHERQIFSCSALRFAQELFLADEERAELGEICRIVAISPMSWAKYSPHLIEPVLVQFPDLVASSQIAALRTDELTSVCVRGSSALHAVFTTLGHCPCRFSISYVGKEGQIEKGFSDSFAAFKKTLQAFLDVVRGTSRGISYMELQSIIRIIEAGMP